MKTLKTTQFVALALIVTFSACREMKQTDKEPQAVKSPTKLDIQGHRGARGLYPENTIGGFIKALEIGVNTLELDVVVSKDSQLVVSHEPWLSKEICLTPEGDALGENYREKYNMYQMTYAEIRAFDCGSKPHPHFPEQEKVVAHKPLLSAVFDSVESYIQSNNLERVYYNIETKSTPEGDNVYHPEPDNFAELLYQEIKEHGLIERSFVQSFDVRTLQYLRKHHPEVRLVLLVSNDLTFEENLEKLGFIPEVYSPNYELVKMELVKRCHEKDMQIIPWTVNEKSEMKALIEMGVDGIITDYPNLAVEFR